MAIAELDSVCTFDCPDTCSLTVTVEDGHIVKVRGSEAVPLHRRRDLQQGRAATSATSCTGRSACCIRCAAPGRRARGSSNASPGTRRWTRSTRGSATVIGRWGPQAVTPLNYAGPHGLLAGDSMSLRFFHRLGATQLYRRSLCGGVRSEAWAGTYGAVPGCPPEFAEHAKLNVVWGNNATVANLHLVRSIRHAKRKGGRLVVVDPLRTKIAEQADLHLQLLPGTDMLLAWSRRRRARTARRARRSLHRRDTCSASRSSWRWRANGRPRARRDGLRRCRRARSSPSRAGWPRPIRWCWRPATGWNAAATAAAASAPRSRLPALLGKLGNGSGIVLGAEQRLPQDPGQIAAAGSRARGHPHAQHQRYRPASGRGRHRPAVARAVHLQPQSDRRASRPEPHAPRPRARRCVRGRHRCDDDREHDPLRRGAARRRPISNAPISIRLTGITGCSAPRR